MQFLTNMISVISCLCILVLCNAEESGWTPVPIYIAQSRYGSNSNNHNYVNTRISSDGYQSSNDNAYETTSKYDDSRIKQEGAILNFGVNVQTYKAAPSYNSVGTSKTVIHGPSDANLGVVENQQQQQQRPFHGMSSNMNAYNSAGSSNNDHRVGYNTAINGDPFSNIKQYTSSGTENINHGLRNNFGGASISYGDVRDYKHGGLNVATNYKGGSGYDGYAITSYRGTSVADESKGDFGKTPFNYATRRPISYDQNLNNKVFDQNRNPNYNVNIRNNVPNGGNVVVAHDQISYHPLNNNNNNHGFMKSNVYTNNDNANNVQGNSQADFNSSPFNIANNKGHNVLTVGENNGPANQVNNNYNLNDNNSNNNNNNNNHGFIKSNVYKNNDNVNNVQGNSQADFNSSPFNIANNKGHNVLTVGENNGPANQVNNNYNLNDNNNNNAYGQGSPNDNMNVHPTGTLNNGVKSTYAVDDNYIDGPPLRKPQAPQFYQHQAILPAFNPPISSIKQSQQTPSMLQYPHAMPDSKPYQPDFRPPIASEGYSPSPRPLMQGVPPTPSPMVTSTFIPQPPHQLPMKLIQPPPPQQQNAVPQQALRHPAPAPNRQPNHPKPENQFPNQEILQDPNAINDSFFHHLMKVITNTLFYGDLEPKRH